MRVTATIQAKPNVSEFITQSDGMYHARSPLIIEKLAEDPYVTEIQNKTREVAQKMLKKSVDIFRKMIQTTMNPTTLNTTVALLCMALGALSANTASAAEEARYVDSVYSWGSWELGIEPAAGPQAPVRNVMNYRDSGIQFRPNDNASYVADAEEVPQTSVTPPPAPPVIPTPAATPVVDTTPLGPGAPIPTGGPTDGLF